MKLHFIKLILCLVIASFLFCVTNSADNTGTGHDGEMKVIGTVQTVEGKAVEGLDVRILPVTFNPLTDTLDSVSNEAFTLQDGSYEFIISDSGYYTISAFHKASNSYLYLDSLYINENIEDQGVDTLKTANTLTVFNVLSDTSAYSGFIIYILGTDLILDTLLGDSSTLLIPSDTVNIKISNLSENKEIIQQDDVYPDDTLSNKIIIEDSVSVFNGKLNISAVGQSGTIWKIDSGDTLPITLSFSLLDSAGYSYSVDDFYIFQSDSTLGSFKMNWLDDTIYNFILNDYLDSLMLFGSVDVSLYINSQLVDSLYLNSDTILIIKNKIVDHYINITGHDTAFLEDTASYAIVSDLNSLDSLMYTVRYYGFEKRPSDSLFEEVELTVLNTIEEYYTELGEYKLYAFAKVIVRDSLSIPYDSFFVYSDTMKVNVISTDVLGSIKLTANKYLCSLGEELTFMINYSDAGDDTLNPHFNFKYSDGTESLWSSSPVDSHSFNSVGTYHIIGTMINDSEHVFTDTISISVSIDTLDNDSIVPPVPDKPTGTDFITVNSNRYYVTDASEFIVWDDTLYYEYRFTWNDTITDSSYSPNGDLPNASNWDTIPYSQKSWSVPGIYFVRVQRRFIKYPHKMSMWSAPTYVKVFNSINDSLIDTAYFNVPKDPVGDDTVAINQDGTFITSGASCVIPGNVEYRFDWGDGTFSDWSNNAFAQKQWDSEGYYEIKAQARSFIDTAAVSQWSGSLPVLVNLTGRQNR